MTTSADSGSTELELIQKELSTKSMILVMGITGVGKSSFINQLPLKSAKRARVSHTQGSCKYITDTTQRLAAKAPRGTSKCETFIARVGGEDVMVVDTPGFDDDTVGVTDADTLHQIAKMLAKQHDMKMRLKGIIYLQRISDNRIGHSGRRALRILREICGDSALENVILTTTRWGENRDGHDEARETYLLEDVWDPLLRMRAGKQRYHGTPDSAIGIVQDLLGRDEVLLDIQKEIFDGRELGKTSAGTLVTDNLEELQVELEKSLHEIDRLRRQLSNNDEAGRIRTDRQFANEQERMNQAKAAEKLLEERLREEIRAEIRAEFEAGLKEAGLKAQQAKRSRSEKAQTAAKIASSVITAAVAIISGIFGLDPSLAEAVRGWFQ